MSVSISAEQTFPFSRKRPCATLAVVSVLVLVVRFWNMQTAKDNGKGLQMEQTKDKKIAAKLQGTQPIFYPNKVRARGKTWAKKTYNFFALVSSLILVSYKKLSTKFKKITKIIL